MQKVLDKIKVFDPKRKIFEFNDGDKFWVVATSGEEARKCLIKDYNYVVIEDMNIREVPREEHFDITHEPIEGEKCSIDIWNCVDKDAADKYIRVPYMVASTIE